MSPTLKKAWTEVVQPFLQRPSRLQVAALCYRKIGGKMQVLLITSRDTGRWIIPKGWPMDGKSAPEAALQEAWEEAGVKRGRVTGQALGQYSYDKELKSGLPVPVDTLVFPVEVGELRDTFPEAGERTREWFSPKEAARKVQEPKLKSILRAL